LTHDPRTVRLLAGPSLDGDPETLAAHRARLGDVPGVEGVWDLIPTLEASGLLGRGGAGFPVGRKWRALAQRSAGPAVVVVNGAEGEPASFKDRVLMAQRPHLVLDGAVLAADAIGADEIVVYVGVEHDASTRAMRRAIADRGQDLGRPTRLVSAPMGYVAGEATAAVNFINTGDARPVTTPPRVSERGVHGRPTLVQNVESLAYAALIARFGERWYRGVGRLGSRGTALITITGAGTVEGFARSSSAGPSARSSPRPVGGRPTSRPSSSGATSGRGRVSATSGIYRLIRS
jgi:NADH:ubiquinone oxidoreductase subunit F (NADH-binding)